MKKIVIVLCAGLFLLSLNTQALQLSGTYTVDPAGAATTNNFKTVLSAIQYMNGGVRVDGGPVNSAPFGVSGPVIFNIAPGTYTEAPSFNFTTGASATNTITFQKNPALTGDVIFTVSITSGAAMWNMQSGAKFITLKNLTFRPTITSASNTVSYMVGYGLNTTIDNVFFDFSNTSGANIIGVYNCTDVAITNSIFQHTLTNVYRGSALRVCTGVIFNNNTVKNMSFSAAYVKQANGNIFRQGFIDIISDLTVPSTFNDNTLDNATLNVYGVYANLNIERNKININQRYFEGPSSGQQIGSPVKFESSGNASAVARIANNFISINQNTIIPGSCALYTSGQSYQIEIFHNSISVNSTQQDVYPIIANSNITVKNNIFSSSTTKAVYLIGGTWNSNNYYSPVSPAFSVTDLNARTEKVNFVSASDLHHTSLCLKGASLPTVGSDIDNLSRSATAPVMGATEAAGVSLDGGIKRLISPVIQYQAGTSTQPISIKVNNAGSSAISSISASYTLNNGAPVSETFTGLNIAPCDSATISFTLPVTFPQNRTALGVYLTAINGAADPNLLNDSVRTNIDVLGPMHGIYTVNPAAAATPFNFQRIGQADTAMMLRTIDAAVEIQIYNGTYSQSDITLGAVTGSSAMNTITFTSFSQDSVQAYISSAFTINGTSHVIIRRLNLDNVIIDGNVSDYLITNNQIKKFTWTAGNDIAFKNNYVKPLQDISFASKSGAYIENVVVDNNTFRNVTYYNTAGVGTVGVPYAINWTKVRRPSLTNNRFNVLKMINVGYGIIGSNPPTVFSYPYGSTFQFDRCTDSVFIERNKFDSITTDRFVHDIDLTNQNNIGPRVAGIVIRNNFFSVTDQLQMTPYAGGNSNAEFYYNNINNRGATGFYLTSNLSSIKNNIFSSDNGSRALTYNTPHAAADYNDVYTAGPVLAVNASTNPAASYATFAQYRTATSSNANGKNVNPKYTDSADLHAAHPALLATGTPWPVLNPILKDIDSDNRNQLNPCIGADEFTAPSADVIAQQFIGQKINFAAGTALPLAIKIKNNGSANLNQVKVRWALNGIEQLPPYNWTGDVPYDSSTTIAFGTQLFDMMKYNSLKIWTELPNNAADMVPVNDTIRVDSIMPYARGLFTLGGTTPNVISFTKAAELLTYGGVDSAVNISIRNGKYTEQAIMKYVRGTSLANTITFRGENNSAALDTLSFSSLNSGLTPFFTMRLDSAAYFTFKHLTVQSLSSYSRAVEFTRKTRFVTFDSCEFTAAASNAGYAHIEGNTLNSLPQLDSNVVFSNNKFKGGYGGIVLPLRNGIIKGNRFENFVSGNFSVGMIHLTGTFAPLNNTLLIDSNYIFPTQTCLVQSGGVCLLYSNNSIAGINISSTSAENDITVSRNRINVTGRNGITISTSGTAAKPIRVFNNFVTIRSSGTAMSSTGIYTQIIHNSFADSVNSSSNLVELRGTNSVFRNNILIKGLPGAPVSGTSNLLNITSAIAATLTSTHNAFGIPDSTKAFYTGSVNMTLSQWKATGKDDGSVKAAAGFVNISSDLHMDKNKAGAIDVVKKGIPIANVSTDIDDSTRSLITPCIGADEYTLHQVDAGITAMTAPVSPMAPGNNPVIVSIRNFGEQNVSAVQINWSVNGTMQSPYSFAGNLATGDSAVNLNIGSYNFNQPVGYNVKAWIETVNGSMDANRLNDTVARLIYPALCGSYTVGGAAPDFTTPKLAMDYAALAGVTCATVFNIRDGQYYEANTLNAVAGTSATNTLTIQSENLDSTKVTLYQTDYLPSGSGNVLTINGAKYVKLKHLGIKRTAEAGIYHFYFAVMSLTNDVTGLSITNCELSTTGGSAIIPYPLSATNIPSNITISNNNFIGGVPISLSGYPTPLMQNVTISNNNFRAPIPSAGAAQVALQYIGNLTVHNNYFDSSKLSTSVVPGISLANSSGKMSITSNKIIKRKGTSGITMSSVTGLNFADSAVVIANNFIEIDSVGTGSALYGNNMGRNVKVVYNNLLNNCTTTGSNSSYALYFSNSFGTGTLKDTIANNNIIVSGTGYALFQNQNSANDEDCTNNNIWAATGTKLAKYNNTDYTTLTSLATASGTHTATVSMNPSYVNINDLHVAELNLRNLGKPLPYVLNDIDNDVRGLTTSTIGADEIVIGSNDAGISGLVAPVKPFAPGNQTVSVTIKNFGTDPLTSATINWSINGAMQPPVNYSGSIAFNTSATAILGNVNFVIDSNFIVRAWTTAPNGAGDTNSSNDTATVSNIYPALSGVYTLGGVSPNFRGFVRSSNNLKYGGMLGNVIFNVRDGKYNEAMTVDSIGFQNNYSVTWQGESADSSKALLAYNTSTGDNNAAVIQLNNTKNITIKNLGVQVKIPQTGASATYKSLIYLSKASRNTKFISNMFVDSSFNVNQFSNTTGSRFFYNTGESDNSNITLRSNDSALVIDRNSFRQVNNTTNPVIELGGSTHAIFQGTAIDVYMNNAVISNNSFDMLLAGKPAVNITEADSIRITGNKLVGTVSLTGKDLILFDKNRVYHEGTNKTVVSVNAGAGRAAGKPVIISNNMIQSNRVGTTNSYPAGNIALSITGDRVNILHNTIATSDTGTTGGYTGAVLNLSATSLDTIKNNIFYNPNGGYMMQHSSVTNLVSNYNDYVYGRNFSNNATSLAAYRTLLSQDGNSVEKINPYFRGANDLHASNILIKVAQPVSPTNTYVAADIDGQPRSTPVCTGADEFLQPANDMVLLTATPQKVFGTGTNNFAIRVYNNGSNPITKFNAGASITNFPDNFPTAVSAGNLNYTFNGNIAPGAEATVSLGQMTVPLFRNIFKINITNLNNGTDEIPFSDSLQNDNYYAGLNGSYTFKNNSDPTVTTFRNINDVITQLKLGGVYGPSSLNLIPGMHNAYVYIDSIPNRGALSPLTIQSANGDTATTGLLSSSGFTMYRANNVTLKNLYFGPDFGNVSTIYQMALGWNSQFINIEGCKIVNATSAYANAASGTSNAIFMSGNWQGQTNHADSNYSFKNNLIVGGITGIRLGGIETLPTKNIVISGNKFINQYNSAVDITVAKLINIDSNSVQSNSANISFKAINLVTTPGRTLVQRNKINILKDGYGIYTDATNYGGILSFSDTLRIMNNFVTVGESQPSLGIYTASGTYGKQMQVVYNSVNNRSTSASSGAYFYTTNAPASFFRNDVLNNIFFNKSAGVPVTMSTVTTANNIQHNNNLYTTGSVLAKINGTNYATLAAVNGTAMEYGSVVGDPLFVSDFDLHTDGAVSNNSGTYDASPFTMIDIDTEARSVSNPDMGADEYTLPNFGAVQMETPLSSCAHTTTEIVKVWVKNFGTQPRLNVPVAYRINTGGIVRDTVRTNINAGDSVLFTFAQTANLAAPMDYYFDVWTAYRGDSLPANDTLKQFLVATTPANNMLPYYTGFEGTNAGWYTGGQNSTFSRGVIFSGVIDSSANGLNGWKSNLIGPHKNNERSYLYSPCFDLTAVTADPTLNFNLAFQLESNDKAWVEYSSNAGATWAKLGAQGEGLAWYNNAGNYWTGNNHYWHNAKHLLPVMAMGDRSAVRVRFVLETNGSIIQDGLAVDDVSIYAGMNAPVSAGTYTNRTATSNAGGTFIPVNDPSGNRILEINDGTNNLGTITVDVQQTSPTLYNGNSYLGRSFVIRVQNQPTTPVIVRLFITQAEFDEWQLADPTVDQVRSIGVYKFSGAVEDFDVTNNTGGTPLNISPAQVTKIPYLDGYFLEFSVSSFSEFWITKGNPPATPPTCVGTGISFTAATTGATYQWQVNNGAGYTNISDDANYSGTSTATLQLNNMPTSYSGFKYRAVVDGINGPDNILRFILTWTGASGTDWSTPSNWSCSTIPDEFTDVIIPTGAANNPVVSGNASVRKVIAQTGTTLTVSPGARLDIKGK